MTSRMNAEASFSTRIDRAALADLRAREEAAFAARTP